MARTEWLSFLDDDNEFRPDHLATLVATATTTRARAVHSWREYFTEDGAPFLQQVYPWSRNREEGKRRYRALVAAGIFTVGSNIAKDRADPKSVTSPIRTVDANCWLLSRTLLLGLPFREEYSKADLELMIGDDDKLLSDLVEENEPIACTRLATVRYYLGGFSNRHGAWGASIKAAVDDCETTQDLRSER